MNPKPWFRLKEEELLERRISEFGLKIEETPAEKLVLKLYSELTKKNLAFLPPCFPAEEWFCPVGIAAIGVPFYLLHPKLKKLEQKMILDVEGGSRAEFMKLIRHETGHAYSYAYDLYKKPTWRRLFGSATAPYLETYRPRPYSRSYVVHLDNWYAQSHPDEDWAETFAVWLTPGLAWKKRYRNWKAIKKLEYVDKVMSSIAEKPAKNWPQFKPKEYDGLNKKLKTYFRQKRKLYEESYPDFYDRDLKRLFTDLPEESSDIKAFKYLKSMRPLLLKSVAFWTKEKKYTIDQLITDFIERTQELGLHVRKNHSDMDIQITSYVTTLVKNHLFTGKFKRSK